MHRVSKTNHYGYMGSQMAKIENSQIQPFGPKEISTNDGAIKTYTGAPLKPPSAG